MRALMVHSCWQTLLGMGRFQPDDENGVKAVLTKLVTDVVSQEHKKVIGSEEQIHCYQQQLALCEAKLCDKNS